MLQVEITSRLRQCCALEGTRYAVNGAQVIGDGEGAVWIGATDGRCGAVVRLRCDGAVEDLPSICPASILPNTQRPGRLMLNGDWADPKSQKSAPPIDATFPPLHDVMPNVGDGEYRTVIGINVDLLAAVARAVGRTGHGTESGAVVTLIIGEPNRAIGVLGCGGESPRFGVVMPCNVEADADRSAYLAAVASYKSAVK